MTSEDQKKINRLMGVPAKIDPATAAFMEVSGGRMLRVAAAIGEREAAAPTARFRIPGDQPRVAAARLERDDEADRIYLALGCLDPRRVTAFRAFLAQQGR